MKAVRLAPAGLVVRGHSYSQTRESDNTWFKFARYWLLMIGRSSAELQSVLYRYIEGSRRQRSTSGTRDYELKSKKVHICLIADGCCTSCC